MAGPRGIYSIGAIARMLGLSQPTLRSWEERYGLVVAERSGGGRRLYTRDQLEQLQFVKDRVDEGLSAADAHRLLAERLAGADTVAAQRTSSPPDRVRLLLAESDRYAAELGELYLRAEGFEVDIALSGQDAEEKFVSQPPALSIVELMISGGVGRELCERLKRRRATPVLCVSSLDLEGQALAAGADAFLQKPLEPRQLVSTVKDLLDRGASIRTAPGAAR